MFAQYRYLPSTDVCRYLPSKYVFPSTGVCPVKIFADATDVCPVQRESGQPTPPHLFPHHSPLRLGSILTQLLAYRLTISAYGHIYGTAVMPLEYQDEYRAIKQNLSLSMTNFIGQLYIVQSSSGMHDRGGRCPSLEASFARCFTFFQTSIKNCIVKN